MDFKLLGKVLCPYEQWLIQGEFPVFPGQGRLQIHHSFDQVKMVAEDKWTEVIIKEFSSQRINIPAAQWSQ